jgi:hypothetical protein
LAAATKLIVCGVPGLTVIEGGVAVTPDGNPASDTLTLPLNPFIPFAETEICCAGPPLVREMLPG